MELWMVGLILSVGPILVGLVVGSRLESSHYQSIREREVEFARIPALSTKTPPRPEAVTRAMLVSGNVTLSMHRFKQVLAGFRNIFGGEIQSYSSVIDRARREAVLRMKESAPDADLFLNVRLDTATVGIADEDSQAGTVDVVAYGTAVWYR